MSIRRPSLLGIRYLLEIGLVAGGYKAAAGVCTALAYDDSSFTAVWAPAGVALAAVVVGGFRMLPGVALGAILASASTGVPPLIVLAIATGATLGALVGTSLLRLADFRPSVDRVRDVVALLLLAGVVGPTVSSTIRVASLRIGGVLEPEAALSEWRLWWLGGLCGVLVVAPPLLLLTSTRPRLVVRPKRALEALVLTVLLLVTAVAVFTHAAPIASLFFPLLVWAGTRFGQAGATTTTLFVAAAAVWFTASGSGPFAASSVERSLALSQTFIASAAVIGLVLAATRSERRLARAERARLATILASVDEAIVTADLGGRITEWNPAAERLYGFSRDEIIGRPVLTHVPRDLHEATMATVGRVRRGDRVRLETVRRRKDGARAEVSISASPILSDSGAVLGTCSISRDISARKGADRERERVLAESRAVLHATTQGILMTDVSGEVRFANQAMDAFWKELGSPAEGSVWDRLARLAVLTETPDAYIRDFVRLVREPEAVYEGDFTLAASGRSFRGRTAPVYDAGGALIGRIFSLVETTAERAAERAKDEFVGIVSHELRTPLASIVGYLDALEEVEHASLSDEGRRFMGVMRRNADALHTLVDDLLLADQLRDGTLRLEARDVDLAVVVAECVERVQPLAEKRGIALTVDDAVSGARLSGDRRRVEQILDNLLSNALKFTPAGGSVAVTAAQQDDRAVVHVADTGPGIPEEDRKRLFERFYRSASATERAVPGSGLGLAIAQAIAEAHRGSLELVEQTGPGATFRLSLPLAAASSERSAA